VEVWTLSEVARLLRLPPARLRYWRRTALLSAPSERPPPGCFDFRDVVGIKRVAGLREHGIPLQRIRRSLRVIRERMPQLERPLSAIGLWSEGSRRLVVRDGAALLEPDGQLVIDLGAPAASDRLLRLAAPGSAPGGPGAALHWFERGCELDTDAATWAEAVAAYERALEAAPDFADAHCNLGALHQNRGQRERARACYERALAFEPGHFEASLNLANLLEEDDANEAALRHYKAAVRAAPLNAEARLQLALLYEKLALRRSAREQWRRYVQLDPTGSWVEVARRRLAD
jgi:tetratricopeptide (TPR) repeat protein